MLSEKALRQIITILGFFVFLFGPLPISLVRHFA